MGVFASQPMLDPENVGHILLGTSAFLSWCYVVIYRMLIFGEQINWLSGFWLGYTVTQSIKCVITVESNLAYGYTYGYTQWPDITRFLNMCLTFVVSFWNLCLWVTLLFKAGSDFNTKQNIFWHQLALKIILALFAVELAITIVLYLVYMHFAFSAAAYTLPIAVSYVVAFMGCSFSALGRTLRGAYTQSLVAIDAKHYDNAVTIRFLWCTVCLCVVGTLLGGWSGIDAYTARIGKAGLGLFYVLPTTALVHYLERFENFKHLLSGSSKAAPTQKQDVIEAQMAETQV